MLKEAQLKPHQLEIAKNIIKNPKAYIISDMGSGKTASTLYALHLLELLGEKPRALIVAPLNVAKFSWATEFTLWDFTQGAKVINLAGKNLATRKKLLKEPHDYCVINRELIRWMCQYFDFDLPYDTLIYDEISRLKGGNTFSPKRVRPDGTVAPRALSEFGHLKKVAPDFSRVVGLTGTPLQDNILDLWGQYHILDQGERLELTKNRYLQTYFSKPIYGFKYTPHDWAEDKVISLVRDITFAIDVPVELPPVEIVDHTVHLSGRELERYREFEKEFVFQVGMDPDDDIEAVNDGVLYGKLLQLANGSIYKENGDHEVFHDHKIKKLKELISNADGNVLVFYNFQFDIARIKKAIKGVKVFSELKYPVTDWNDKKIKVLLLHPASAGHGLNLQFGGHEIIWMGLTHSSELYQQANARLRRPGQLSRVKIHRIVADKTVDQKIGPRLAGKVENMDRFIEGMKE